MIHWDGIYNFMITMRGIVMGVPGEIYEVLKISFFLFVTLSVVKVLSFTEG